MPRLGACWVWTEDRVVGGRRGRGWPVGASWDTRARSQPSAALFEACCGDHIQPFDDEEDDDIWEDKEAHCTARVTARARCAAPPPSPSVPQERGPRVVPRPCSDWSPQVWGPSGFREQPGAWSPGPGGSRHHCGSGRDPSSHCPEGRFPRGLRTGRWVLGSSAGCVGDMSPEGFGGLACGEWGPHGPDTLPFEHVVS